MQNPRDALLVVSDAKPIRPVAFDVKGLSGDGAAGIDGIQMREQQEPAFPEPVNVARMV